MRIFRMKYQIRKSVAQQIVDTVKDVCSHDINFINRSGIIFASTDASRVGNFHEIGRQVIKSGETIEVETDDSFFGTHKGVNIPFLYKGEVIAAIGITGKPSEVRKYAYLAQKITMLILREQELDEQNNNKKTQLNYMIRSLILGENVIYDYYMDFVKQFQINLKEEFCTIIVQIDSKYNPANFSIIENNIYQAFDQTGAKLYTFSYPNEYIVLIETERFKKFSYIFRQLAKDYTGILKIGVGNSAALAKQNQSYQAAKIALSSLMGRQNIAVFDQLDLEILLGSIPTSAKQQFIEKIILSLSEKDRMILKTYFGCNMSLKKACDLLFMHKNTLQYQLDRIWKNCNYNPRCFQDAVILYLGLKLLSEAE